MWQLINDRHQHQKNARRSYLYWRDAVLIISFDRACMAAANWTSLILPPATVDVVGNVCESGDIFARDRVLAMPQLDVLAIDMADAYLVAGFRIPIPAVAGEVILANGEHQLARPRLSVEQMLAAYNWSLIHSAPDVQGNTHG